MIGKTIINDRLTIRKTDDHGHHVRGHAELLHHPLENLSLTLWADAAKAYEKNLRFSSALPIS